MPGGTIFDLKILPVFGGFTLTVKRRRGFMSSIKDFIRVGEGTMGMLLVESQEAKVVDNQALVAVVGENQDQVQTMVEVSVVLNL